MLKNVLAFSVVVIVSLVCWEQFTYPHLFTLSFWFLQNVWSEHDVQL